MVNDAMHPSSSFHFRANMGRTPPPGIKLSGAVRRTDVLVPGERWSVASEALYAAAMRPRSSWNLTVVGWVLFTVSAVCFTVQALRAGSVIGLVASLSFLLACLVFMVPVIADRPRSGDARRSDGGVHASGQVTE